MDDVRITSLMHACQQGDIHRVNALLDAGVNPNARFMSDTPLICAIYSEHEQDRMSVVLALIDAGADVNFPPAGSSSAYDPLSAAAGKGDIELCKLLLKHGARDGTDRARGLALRNAVYSHHLPLVRLLLAHNFCTIDALHVAARTGHVEIVEELIKAGCDVNEKTTYYPHTTPLLIAQECGHDAVVRALVDAGADMAQAGPLGVMLAEANKELQEWRAMPVNLVEAIVGMFIASR